MFVRLVDIYPDPGTEPGLAAVLAGLYPKLRKFAAIAAPPEMAPDDLVHDAIVAALRAGGFEQIESPGPYLKRTILNLASNERRRLGRRRRALATVASETDGVANDAYPSDLSYLAELSPKARAVLFLHYVEGDPFETVARDLGLSASSVRQTATRARRSLRRMIGDQQ